MGIITLLSSSGVALCSALHIFLPDIFSAEDLSHVHRGANDAIKRSNMRKFLRALTEYYSTSVHVPEADLGLPDVVDLIRGSVAAVRNRWHWRPSSITRAPSILCS